MTDFTDDEVRQNYTAYLDLLVAQVRPLLMMPVRQLVFENEHMQAIAPIFDPTAFMRGGGTNLTDQRRVLDAALALRQVLQSFAPPELTDEELRDTHDTRFPITGGLHTGYPLGGRP